MLWEQGGFSKTFYIHSLAQSCVTQHGVCGYMKVLHNDLCPLIAWLVIRVCNYVKVPSTFCWRQTNASFLSVPVTVPALQVCGILLGFANNFTLSKPTRKCSYTNACQWIIPLGPFTWKFLSLKNYHVEKWGTDEPTSKQNKLLAACTLSKKNT